MFQAISGYCASVMDWQQEGFVIVRSAFHRDTVQAFRDSSRLLSEEKPFVVRRSVFGRMAFRWRLLMKKWRRSEGMYFVRRRKTSPYAYRSITSFGVGDRHRSHHRARILDRFTGHHISVAPRNAGVLRFQAFEDFRGVK